MGDDNALKNLRNETKPKKNINITKKLKDERREKYFQDIQGVGSQETTVVKLHSTKNEQEGGRRASLAKRRKQKK